MRWNVGLTPVRSIPPPNTLCVAQLPTSIIRMRTILIDTIINRKISQTCLLFCNSGDWHFCRFVLYRDKNSMRLYLNIPGIKSWNIYWQAWLHQTKQESAGHSVNGDVGGYICRMLPSLEYSSFTSQENASFLQHFTSPYLSVRIWCPTSPYESPSSPVSYLWRKGFIPLLMGNRNLQDVAIRGLKTTSTSCDARIYSTLRESAICQTEAVKGD